jgi:hypothetical protein
MAQSRKEGSPESVAALAGLLKVISRPATRKAFHADPIAALREAKIDPAHLPADVLDHLSGFSLEELRLLSHLNSTLVGAGMRATADDGGTVAIL